MKVEILFRLFIIIFLFSQVSYVRAAKNKIMYLKKELTLKSSKIVKVAAQIRNLESNLNKKNDQYLKSVKKLKSSQKKLNDLYFDLKKSDLEIDKEEARLTKLSRMLILESIDNESQGQLVSRTVLAKSLKQKLSDLSELKFQNEKMVKSISFFSRLAQRLENEERELYSFIVDLEREKKNAAQSYIKNLESKNELEERLENALAKKVARAKVKKTSGEVNIDFDIILPIKRFTSYKGSAQGVTFTYDSTRPLYSCARGSVEYAGALSNYGSVIILKHKGGVRSVLLGSLKGKVKKGQVVKRGQIVGYTAPVAGKKRTLYFEIRKKNKVQNTLSWLKNKNKNLL